MPRIHDLLDSELILDDLRAADRDGVIRELAGLLARTGRVADEARLAQDILDREGQGSTGIGNGVAVPHARSGAVPDMVVVFGRSRKGVDFGAIDGRPVHLFFLLVTPEARPADHLKTLARISRIIRSADLRRDLMACTDPGEMQRLILDEDDKYPSPR